MCVIVLVFGSYMASCRYERRWEELRRDERRSLTQNDGCRADARRGEPHAPSVEHRVVDVVRLVHSTSRPQYGEG